MISKIKRIIKSNGGLFLFLKQGLIYFRYLKSLGQTGLYDKLSQYKTVEKIVVSEKGKHCYFGYYDKSPLDSKSQRVLFVRLPKDAKEGDVAEVCICDMATKTQTVIGKTCAWNWQQACMEQWVNDEVVSYNRYDAAKKEYQAVLHNFATGTDTVLARAAYAYNKDYSKYLSLNFYRLDKYAKGYGYPYQVDSMVEKEDGIWEVDVNTGEIKLILTLSYVMAYNPHYSEGIQHYINHVTYCPDENYVMFIHRWQERGETFTSRLLLFNKKTGEISTILDNGHVSHYCWKSDKELLIFATNKEMQKGYMILNIYTGETSMVEGLPLEDGHPSYSADERWILTDTYPNNGRKQYLFLFDTEKKKLKVVDKLWSPFTYYNEFRCDLHPRWSKDNRYVVVDNTATGVRTLNIYKV